MRCCGGTVSQSLTARTSTGPSSRTPISEFLVAISRDVVLSSVRTPSNTPLRIAVAAQLLMVISPQLSQSADGRYVQTF